MIKRLLSYSICLAIVITAAAFVLNNQWRDFVLWPGIMCQVMLNGFLLLIPTGDDFYTLPSASYLVLNTLVYASVIFGMAFSVIWMKNNWRD